MIVDIDKYRIQKDFVRQKYLDAVGQYGMSYMISSLAVSTMCPAIVIAYWVGEITNWDPEAVKSIENLIKFYGYTEVFNIPEGAPKLEMT